MTSIEELNKNQIILLTILISFVTAIATGIITTTLLEEAPSNVTQTINRVVERTIEKAVPSPATGRVLTKDDEELLSAIEKSSQAVVAVNVTNGSSTPRFLSLGVIVSNGLIVTAKGKIEKTGSYSATLSDKTTVPLSVVTIDEAKDIAVLKIAVPEEKTATTTDSIT